MSDPNVVIRRWFLYMYGERSQVTRFSITMSDTEQQKAFNTTAMQIHDEAMKLAEEADAALRKGKQSDYDTLLNRAMRLEVQAASYFTDTAYQPTRAIMYRSAANLAYQCGDLEIALKMARESRVGNTPAHIDNEMRSMIKSITGEDPGELISYEEPEPVKKKRGKK